MKGGNGLRRRRGVGASKSTGAFVQQQGYSVLSLAVGPAGMGPLGLQGECRGFAGGGPKRGQCMFIVTIMASR